MVGRFRVARDGGRAALISGAGMANVLTGVVKGYAQLGDLVIGMPLSDDATGGLCAILSTVEKPPRNAVLATPLNGSYAAANIAYRFAGGSQGEIVLLQTRIEPEVTAASEALSKLGLTHRLDSVAGVQPDDIVITPFLLYPGGPDRKMMVEIDKVLAGGRGVQVAVANEQLRGLHYEHLRSVFVTDLAATGLANARGYANAAMIAATLTRNDAALGIVASEREKKAQALSAREPYLAGAGTAR